MRTGVLNEPENSRIVLQKSFIDKKIYLLLLFIYIYTIELKIPDFENNKNREAPDSYPVRRVHGMVLSSGAVSVTCDATQYIFSKNPFFKEFKAMPPLQKLISTRTLVVCVTCYDMLLTILS